MSNHSSAEKRARQNIKRRFRNRTLKSAYRTEIKKFVALIADKKTEDAQKMLPKIHRTIDQAQTKGILPKNTASRKKSRMNLLLNKVLAET